MVQTVKSKASPVIINGQGLILGRMCSKVAKRALNGEQIIIVNAEKAIISGKRKSKVAEAKEFLEVGAPERGPFHSRRPDRIVRKAVRGMLPWRQPKGKAAYKRVKVFIGVPKDLENQNMEGDPQAQASKLRGPHFTVGELAEQIGWNKGA
jgi:large subunit ribosomal protein L13